MKKTLKHALKYVLLYFLLVALMLGALYLVSFIPKDAVRKNIRRSALILENEGEKVYFNSLGRNLYDDNSSDAIMLNLTYTIDEENKLESIIRARRNYLPGTTKKIVPDVVGNLPYETNKFLMTQELLNTVQGKEQTSFEYGRYWHGYIVIFRILLCLFDISVIRLITQLTMIGLLILLMYYLAQNNSWKLAAGLLFGFIAADLLTWGYIIHGKYVAIIALSISVFIANKKINNNNLNIWLFVSGALTAYFDLLTTPILSLLLPIVIYTAVNNEEISFKEQLIKIVKNFTAWGFGYFCLWCTKWIISDLFYDTSIIKTSITQIFYRIFKSQNEGELGIQIIYALLRNVIQFTNYLAVAMYVFSLMFAVINKKRYCRKGMYISISKVPYYVCIIVTLAWYLVISEHSYKHYFFTYKTMMIPLIATMFIVFDNKKEQKIIKKDVKND